MAIDSQVKVLESVVSKIDSSIEKLTEVSNNIGKLLAVHDERLNTLEKTNDRTEDDIKDLHSRITTISREICDKIDQVESMIEYRLKESSEASAKGHAEIKSDIESKISKLVTRVEILEKWKYWVVGAATAVGYIVNKFI